MGASKSCTFLIQVVACDTPITRWQADAQFICGTLSSPGKACASSSSSHVHGCRKFVWHMQDHSRSALVALYRTLVWSRRHLPLAPCKEDSKEDESGDLDGGGDNHQRRQRLAVEQTSQGATDSGGHAEDGAVDAKGGGTVRSRD